MRARLCSEYYHVVDSPFQLDLQLLFYDTHAYLTFLVFYRLNVKYLKSNLRFASLFCVMCIGTPWLDRFLNIDVNNYITTCDMRVKFY